MTSRRGFPRLVLLSAVLVLAAFAPSARAQGESSAVVDSGAFTVTVGGRVVGHERFSLVKGIGDSLKARVTLMQFHSGAGRTDTLKKAVSFAVDGFDFGLRTYQSVQTFQGEKITRAIVINDTTYTSYREIGSNGEGSTYLLPPGRVYVLDPPVFTNLDAVCLNLKNRIFRTRPVTMLMMTAMNDTVITATVTDAGRDTIRWAGRSMPARHVTLGDQNASYDIWFRDDGRMLRLEHVPTRLRVERIGPTASRALSRRPRTRG